MPPRLPGPPHDVQRRASPREVLQRHPRHARAVVVAGVVELLNPRQVDAVQHRPLPLLVVAHLQHVEAGGPPLLVGVPDHLQPAAGLADVGVHPPGVEPALGPQPRRQRHLAQLPAVDGEAEEARRQHRPHQRAVPEDATRVAEPRERAAAAAAVVPDRRAPRTCPGGVDADAVVPARDDPVLVPRLQRVVGEVQILAGATGAGRDVNLEEFHGFRVADVVPCSVHAKLAVDASTAAAEEKPVAGAGDVGLGVRRVGGGRDEREVGAGIASEEGVVAERLVDLVVEEEAGDDGVTGVGAQEVCVHEEVFRRQGVPLLAHDSRADELLGR